MQADYDVSLRLGFELPARADVREDAAKMHNSPVLRKMRNRQGFRSPAGTDSVSPRKEIGFNAWTSAKVALG